MRSRACMTLHMQSLAKITHPCCPQCQIVSEIIPTISFLGKNRFLPLPRTVLARKLTTNGVRTGVSQVSRNFQYERKTRQGLKGPPCA
jgi:hypothetical protein